MDEKGGKGCRKLISCDVDFCYLGDVAENQYSVGLLIPAWGEGGLGYGGLRSAWHAMGHLWIRFKGWVCCSGFLGFQCFALHLGTHAWKQDPDWWTPTSFVLPLANTQPGFLPKISLCSELVEIYWFLYIVVVYHKKI